MIFFSILMQVLGAVIAGLILEWIKAKKVTA